MKIAYLANFNNPTNNKDEEAIRKAFQDNGVKVESYHEKDFKPDEIVNSDADIFLFHKGGSFYGRSIDELLYVLRNFQGRKVCLYFDKVWQGREQWMYQIIPYTDYVFLSDAQFIARHNFINTYKLHQGIGKDCCYKGKKMKIDADIVMCGQIYGERQYLYQFLTQKYGNRFKVVNDAFDDKLNDLVASAPIMIAPYHPQNDLYWSQRIYELLGRGAFLIHPDLTELRKDYTPDKHFVAVKNLGEMKQGIDYFLQHPEERKKISEAAMKHTLENHTFHHITRELIDFIKND